MTTTIQDILLAKGIRGVKVPSYMTTTQESHARVFMQVLVGVRHNCPHCFKETFVYELCDECEEEMIIYNRKALARQKELHGDIDDGLPF